MKKTIVSMLAITALVFSCKKDDEKSTNELIIGKWNLVSHYENQFYNDTHHRDTSLYPSGYETVEFRNDGKVYFTEFNPNGTYKDTSYYKIEGSNLILDAQDTVRINNITGSDLQIYVKHEYTEDEYDELWANYKK